MSNKNSSTKEIALAINRRRFIYYSSIASAAALIGCRTNPATTARINYKSPNEKLNIGCIGVEGKGTSDIAGCAGENIVALCDVDDTKLTGAGQKYKGATLYHDYREMLEKQKNLDAVVISIPDHHHAPAAIRAIHLGKHVYCQKPLTHTIWEARQLTEAARKYKVATQMGNQGHSHDGNRRLCEVIWSGAIGDVSEVHCWSNRPIWPQGVERPAGADPVPANLNWDLWLGPAPVRPFKSTWPNGTAVYHPISWRGYWDFGCGALGDMGCHILDGANWALKLGAPTSVELVESTPSTKESPGTSAVIRYQFPARGTMPPVTLTWYDGGKKPARPAEMETQTLQENGAIFIGSKGKIFSDTYGTGLTLLPESKMKDYVMPAPQIARVPNNDSHGEWIRACKGGVAASSNFDVSGPFSETVLLGNLAMRVGGKLEWDSKHLCVKNSPEAAQYIRKQYRKGWEV
ncbi:MAG: Gfo/Idh/MocA family oxidoreductase [Verrucomicrobiota bacterium]